MPAAAASQAGGAEPAAAQQDLVNITVEDIPGSSLFADETGNSAVE